MYKMCVTLFCDSHECSVRLVNASRSHVKFQCGPGTKDQQIDQRFLWSLLYSWILYAGGLCHWMECKNNHTSYLKVQLQTGILVSTDCCFFLTTVLTYSKSKTTVSLHNKSMGWKSSEVNHSFACQAFKLNCTSEDMQQKFCTYLHKLQQQCKQSWWSEWPALFPGVWHFVDP